MYLNDLFSSLKRLAHSFPDIYKDKMSEMLPLSLTSVAIDALWFEKKQHFRNPEHSLACVIPKSG